MVLPLIMAGLGYGAQWYGNQQRQNAEELAQYKLNQQQNVLGGAQNAQDAQLQQILQQITEQYRKNQAQLVGAMNPSDRMAAFHQGGDQSMSGIQQVLAALHSQNSPFAQTASGPFAQAQAGEQARAASLTNPLAALTAQDQGLARMGTHDQRAQFDFANASQILGNNMARAKALYGYGDALRAQALARAQGQHDVDMQQAQLAGNGAMLIGGLLQGGSQALGAYQANNGSGNAGADNSFSAPDSGGYQTGTAPQSVSSGFVLPDSLK